MQCTSYIWTHIYSHLLLLEHIVTKEAKNIPQHYRKDKCNRKTQRLGDFGKYFSILYNSFIFSVSSLWFVYTVFTKYGSEMNVSYFGI